MRWSIRLLAVAIIAVVCSAGCASQRYRGLPYSSAAEYIKMHPQTLDTEAERILNNQIWLGMTKDQLLGSWGRPDSINQTVGSWGRDEQYVYNRGGYSTQYVYLRNGIVTAWQN